MRVAHNFAYFNHCMVFGLCHLLAADISCPPAVEETYFAPLCHIKVDKVQLFIVFISEVHGVAVP